MTDEHGDPRPPREPSRRPARPVGPRQPAARDRRTEGRPASGAGDARRSSPGSGERAPRAAGGQPRGAGAPRAGGSPRGAGAPPRRSGPSREELEARPYDPRREARRQASRVPLPEDVDARELDPQVRKQLLTLAKDTADVVARHLVMAGRLMDSEPEQALRHTKAATAMAGRVAAVREANGLVAYVAGEWTEALAELRAARRISGEAEHLPVMADCERALGRPERALAMADDPAAATLSPAARIELLIVCSGARRDLGQTEAAAHMLEVGALNGPVKPWTARLRYAYADALLALGREDEARRWFSEAADCDAEGETDAEDRLLELDGIVLEDHEEPDEPEEGSAPA